MTSLADIEGIGPAYAEKLHGAGIRSTEALLERGGTAKGRKELAMAADISASMLLTWVNHADLFRIHGVGPEYADLLEAAGVDTVRELGQRNPASLYDALIKTNEAKKLVRKTPTSDQVAAWIKQAKSLPKGVEY